ncbi:hypothetical protein J6590_020620 [Homalodisca vitripennis]|nr:hypothetical protein J6590_020620 [Homalodisca vitripennis]
MKGQTRVADSASNVQGLGGNVRWHTCPDLLVSARVQWQPLLTTITGLMLNRGWRGEKGDPGPISHRVCDISTYLCCNAPLPVLEWPMDTSGVAPNRQTPVFPSREPSCHRFISRNIPTTKVIKSFFPQEHEIRFEISRGLLWLNIGVLHIS